ncbi:MAG: hypothetical protein HGB17_13355 [Syntrophobacteraceae bacterium]|nr:hypothetical protein [Syntrophobacteraceae bacterium]
MPLVRRHDGPAERPHGDPLQRRAEVRGILRREDSRLLAVVGPCSIHDSQAALDYARRLKALQKRYAVLTVFCSAALGLLTLALMTASNLRQ